MMAFDLIWAGLAGLAAAILMTLVEYPFWVKWKMEGVAEWQVNWVMISRLRKKWRKISQPILTWTIASHLSHGVVAGVAFRLLIPILYLILPFSKISIMLDSLIYGIILWFIFIVLGRKSYELAGGIKITKRGIFGALLSDSIYGLILGLLIGLNPTSLANF